MCYFAYTEEERQEHTAKEDFNVFKVMRIKKKPDGSESLFSFYHPKEWQVGETAMVKPLILHHHERTFLREECSTIDLGYHSYHSGIAQISFDVTFPPHVYAEVRCRKSNIVDDPLLFGWIVIDDYYIGDITINEGLVTPLCGNRYTPDEFKKFMQKCTLDYHDRIVIADCTIPKGSNYYINIRGEIVSETIRIDSYDTLT